MLVDNKFQLGDIVYLKTDVDQKSRMITKISVSQQGLLYMVVCGTETTDHYEIELSEEKQVVFT
jgi:hypothetical protein